MNELRFDNQVIIVTGAGGAIGAGYAQFLATRGASIVVNDIGVQKIGVTAIRSAADGIVEQIMASGGTAVTDRHDVVHEADMIIRTALDTFGKIDAIINNAGTWDDAKIYDEPPDRFNNTLNVHLTGTINVTRAAWSALAKTGGRIVQTSSAGIFGGSRTTAYPIAKAGIFGSVNALKLSAEAAGIKINGILPIAYSEMIDKAIAEGPQKDLMRKMLPRQVASFVALLCHSTVPFSGMCFDVGRSHASRIVFAHNEGVNGDSPEEFLRLIPELTRTENLLHCGDAADYANWKLGRLEDH